VAVCSDWVSGCCDCCEEWDSGEEGLWRSVLTGSAVAEFPVFISSC